MRRLVYVVLSLVVFSSVVSALSDQVSGQVPSSSSYQVPQSSFSSGGDVDVQSASYSTVGSVGELGVGEADSFSYSARAGLITPREEFLELVVQISSVDLGVLQSNTTAVGVGDFYVRSYINGAYVVQTLSPTLTNESGDTIDSITIAASPATSTNQFGINLVENNCPASVSTDTPCVGTFGLDPAPSPSTVFANGEAASGYNTADLYQYNQNDTIAQSGSVGQAWGRTNFRISYIANINNTLPAGLYEKAHDIVVVSTY